VNSPSYWVFYLARLGRSESRPLIKGPAPCSQRRRGGQPVRHDPQGQGRCPGAWPPDADRCQLPRRTLAAALSDRYDSGLPSSLLNLGATLFDLGRLDDALPIQEEAVAMYQELAGALPDRYRLGLARSQRNLAITLSYLGRPADALPYLQDAATILRELAAAIPERYRAELADDLSDLSEVLSALGRNGEAEAAHCEAEECR
jgi:tetratricopeptide (TPR) repeat protein